MAWTSPRTWVAGETVTASICNTHIRDNLKALGDAWTSYTPTWTATTTNPTIGNGTLTGAYIQTGKRVEYRIDLLWGSTTTAGSGIYSWALPVSQKTIGTAGAGVVLDTGTAWIVCGAYSPTASTVRLQRASTSADLTNSSPITWATGDRISLSGAYEVA